MSKKQKAKAARQATPFDPAEFHLGDLVGALWRATRETIRGHRPEDPGSERYPKATVYDQAVRDYIQGKLVQWGGMSVEQFQAYAADAGASWGIYKGVTKDKPLPDDEDISDKAALAWRETVPPYGDHGQQEVCEALARLHNEGWTRRLLADIWEKWPAFAEARGLPRPEDVKAAAAEPQADHAAPSAKDTVRGRRLLFPLMIWFALLAVLVFAVCFGAWRWGQGDNLWQKILASWPYLALVFGLCVLGFLFHSGEAGRRLLKRCRGED